MKMSIYNVIQTAPVVFRKTFQLPLNAPVAPWRSIRFSENYLLSARKLAENDPGANHAIRQGLHHHLKRCHSGMTGLIHSIFYKKNINTYIHLKPPMERIYKGIPPVPPGTSGQNP